MLSASIRSNNVASEEHAKPAIELVQISVNAEDTEGVWNTGWQIRNSAAKPLRIASVRLPHGQFKSPEKCFEPAVELVPGGTTEFQTLVHCDEAPGLVTENAFVIFNVNWLGEEWRIFVRVRVVVTPKGEPESVSESVTTQKVGFSGVTD